MLPAPSPYGSAQRQSIQYCELNEKPKSPTAVRAVLKAVIFPVPSFFVSRSLISAEMIVQNEMIIETKPMYETGTLNCR